MRKVIVCEWMSLDGVVQAPVYTDEDPSGGFKHGGHWGHGHWGHRRHYGWGYGYGIAAYAADCYLVRRYGELIKVCE